MWVFLAIAALVYAALFLMKLRWPIQTEKIYEKYGIDIGLFQIKFTLSAKGRWITNIQSMKRCKIFYKLGSVLCVTLVVPSLAFLLWNLVKILSLWSSTQSKYEDVSKELVFQPVIPGITFPLYDAEVYISSLFMTTVFHEIGHAIAADSLDVKILGYGLVFLFIIPAAYVDLSTSELTSLSLVDQLKVYTAGIWHNLMLAVMAFSVMFLLPYICMPFYHQGQGVSVIALDANSSVNGPSGVKVGQVLTQVNDCPINTAKDFYGCIKTEGQSKKGFCIPKKSLDDLNCQDCCEKKNATFLSFKGQSDYCLPVRQALESSSRYCVSNECGPGIECIFPILTFPHEALWQIKRRDEKDFLFIGFSTDLYSGIEFISDYIPRTSLAPLGLPLLVEKIFYYTCSFSLALALVNVVPCLWLDGQFIIEALLKLWCEPKAPCISTSFVYFGSCLLFANLLLTFLLLL